MTEQDNTPDTPVDDSIDDTEGHFRRDDEQADDTQGHHVRGDNEQADDTEGRRVR